MVAILKMRRQIENRPTTPSILMRNLLEYIPVKFHPDPI